MTNIYVLRLKGGKYYIGKSEDVMGRYQQHLNGQGSAWTRKYAPVSLEKTIENVSPFEEDKVTKEYMDKYGIENVRGGSYVSLELSEFQIEALKTEIWGAKDKCTQCGRTSHFAKDCYATTDVTGARIVFEEEDEDEWECEYCDRIFTTEFGCTLHEQSCGAKVKVSYMAQSSTCYRCGRGGHYSSDCYASCHVKGYAL